MKSRIALLGALALVLSAGSSTAVRADDDDHEPRMEADFMLGYDTLTGDAADAFDDGGYGGFAFEFDLVRPHKKQTFRTIGLRLTGGYVGNDSANAFIDSKLKGTVFMLDALFVANLTKVIKPYGFIGFGSANVHDDEDVITSGSGSGFDFGIGSKFFFGDHFTMMAELSNQDFQVDGDLDSSPSTYSFVQFRFGAGVRF